MKLAWIINVFVQLMAVGAIPAPRNHEDYDYYLFEAHEEAHLSQFLKQNPHASYVSPSDPLPHYHVVSTTKGSYVAPHPKLHALPLKQLVRRAPIPDSSLERISHVSEQYGINDPTFKDQWHIINPAEPGQDVNVVPVWDMGITGKGVVAAIVDDGLDYESADLSANFCPEGSWDFNDKRAEPKPMLASDYHGTRCAGEIGASKGDGHCGVGVAFDSKVSGIRILSGQITSEEEAAALVYGLDVNDIYSCSWGPADNGKAMEQPEKIVKEAMIKGVQEGRGGKGALYVFASGNGAARGDNCNYDGYTNSIYSITVAAIDHKGLHPSYSEQCTAVMVSTYSSGSGEHINTTDLHDKCTDKHGGTSAAAPLAAGIYSLVLEANPNLTWRDVQHLTVRSAVEIDPTDPSWQDTAVEGRRYSPKYGWGKIDALEMVQHAQNWELVKPQGWYYMPYKVVAKDMSTVGEMEDSFEVTQEMLSKVNFNQVEQITVLVNVETSIRGDIQIDLVSPTGRISTLAIPRPHDRSQDGFRAWTFSTVAHWGENGVGEWKLRVKSHTEGNTFRFGGWQIRMFGDVVDASKAKRFDINEDYSIVREEPEEEKTPGSEDDSEGESQDKPEGKPGDDSDGDSSDDDSDSESDPEMTSTEPVAITPVNNQAEATETETTTEPVAITPVKTPGDATETATQTPTSDNDVQKPSKGQNSIPSTSHFLVYFGAFLVVGFITVMYLIVNGRRSIGRARRRDDFEFDIIHPSESDDDEFDVELNDFDFDEDQELRQSASENDQLMQKVVEEEEPLDADEPSVVNPHADSLTPVAQETPQTQQKP